MTQLVPSQSQSKRNVSKRSSGISTVLPIEKEISTPQFRDTPELKLLVTAKDARREPIHRWFVFPHSFSPYLVEHLIKRYPNPALTTKGHLLDMFSGGGTTLLVGKHLGIPSTGIDIMPFSVTIGQAKIGSHNPKHLKLLGRKLLRNASQSALETSVDLDFAKRLYDPKALDLLLKLSSLIEDLQESGDAKAFLRTALLSTAERAAGAVKAGGFTRDRGAGGSIKRADPPAARSSEEVKQIFEDRVGAMADEVVPWDKDIPACSVLLGDARNIPQSTEKYRWVISSPPYPNRQDYTRVFASELLFTFSSKSEDHRKLRLETLRSHLEAKPPIANDPDYNEPESVTCAVNEITTEIYARKHEAQALANGKSASKVKVDLRIPRMVRGYFEDIHLVLRSLKPQVESGGHVCLVVGNVRHYGVMVEVDVIIAEIGVKLGYRCKEILVARERGNSAQQMQRYARVGARESIVVLSVD